MEDDDDDADSVTASAATDSFVRLSNSFMIDIPSLVLCPLLCFLHGVALSHFLRLQTLRGPPIRIFSYIRE